jgi:hypothetical protein
VESSPIGKNCEVVVFEQSSQLGGTWVFSDHPGDDSQRSMYEGLRSVGIFIVIFENKWQKILIN